MNINSASAYRLAITQLNWAFALAIAVTIERIRTMFETRTEIRRQAREKAIAKAEMKGEKNAAERIRLNMQKQGLQLSPEQEAAIFGNRNGQQR